MMRFRYLVAVPFESHGSEIISYCEHKTPDGRNRVCVTPAATISPLDFSILGQAFSNMPIPLGMEPASLKYRRKSNAIEYIGIPAPKECVARLLSRPDILAAWAAKREKSGRQLLALIACAYRALDSEPRLLAKATKSLLEAINELGAELFLTVLFDEYVFEVVGITAQSFGLNTLMGDTLTSLLRSPQSSRFEKVPVGLLSLKRVRIPLDVAYMPEEVDPQHSAASVLLLENTEQPSGNASRILSFVKYVYSCSEHLSTLWIGVMSTLSCALTRLIPPELLPRFLEEELSLENYLRSMSV